MIEKLCIGNEGVLTSNLSPEDKQCSHDDHEGGGEHLSQQLAVDHSLVGLAGWTLHYIMIHRLHPQAVQLINKSGYTHIIKYIISTKKIKILEDQGCSQRVKWRATTLAPF